MLMPAVLVIRRTVSPVADDARTPDTPSGWWRQLPAVAARISQGGVLPRLLAELTRGKVYQIPT